MSAKDDGTVDVKEQLGGEGRAVLTSSTSTQYSFEQQGTDLSVYTRYLVEGIETGAADLNNDGSISIDELHDYARKKVQETAPAMKPKIYAVEEGFKIRLARVPVGDPKLAYRKEVERCATHGEIFSIDRRILNELRDSLGLTPENATAIEDEVLKPFREYQKKLQRYEEAFAEAVQQEYPISGAMRVRFQRYQDILGLRDEDVAPIQARCVPRKEVVEPPTQSVNIFQPKVATPLPVQPQYREERVSPQRESVQPQNPQVRISQQQEIPSRTDLEQGTATKQASSSGNIGKPVVVYAGLGLLVLIISAITVPSFLNQEPKPSQVETTNNDNQAAQSKQAEITNNENQAAQSKQAEAKQNIRAMNRAQQAYYLENDKYSSSITDLGLGINPETENYSYTTSASGSGMQARAILTATSKKDGLKSYVGGVFVIESSGQPKEILSIAIVCEGNTPSTSRLAPPSLIGGQPQCASGSTELSK
jgi:type II secretory pathway pseudopilin PulG